MMRWVIQSCLAISLFCWSLPLFAQNLKTDRFIQKARLAMAQGAVNKWESNLREAAKAFRLEQKRMTISEKNNNRLWLNLLWSKFFNYQGALPPVKKISDFEGKTHLNRHIKEVEDSIDYLKKSLSYLKRYNQLYMQISQRSNIETRLYIQASLSLERDLQGEIRTGKTYLTILHYARTNWDNKKQLATQKKQIQKIGIQQGNAKAKLAKLKTNQKKLAAIVQIARANYLQYRRNLLQRAKTARIIFWSGVVGMAIGGAGVVVGGLVFRDQEVNRGNMNPAERSAQQDLAIGLMAGFGALFVVGTSGVIIGYAINPGLKDEDQAVIKSHNRYLGEERKKQGR